MKTIAVLYIATGKYIVFWKDFFASCERHFIADARKEYFVFTDSTEFDNSDNERVHIIPHVTQEWPYATLLRFDTFSKARERLTRFDYIFFFNANMLFVDKVSAAEFLPDRIKDDGLMVTLHPGYFNQPVDALPYENEQPLSKAFIPKGTGRHYFMGGLNGGFSGEYIKLIDDLKISTQDDLDQNIIARWHDESQLNHYMLDKNPRILSPAYGYPEDRKLPFEPKIIIRDKNKFGGHSFLRNEKRSLLDRIVFQLKKIKQKL